MIGEEEEFRGEELSGHEQTAHPHADRRKTKRYVLTSANEVPARVSLESGELVPLQNILINDVNVDGMRITAATAIPKSSRVTMVLNLPEPVSLESTIIWHRGAGECDSMMGMEFLVRSRVNDTGIPQLLRWAYSYYGKTSFRVNAPIFFTYETQAEKKSFRADVVVISPRGIEIKNRFPLPENVELQLTFTLNSMTPLVSPRGSVLFQQRINSPADEDPLSETYQIWMEFRDPEAVENHIAEVQKVHPMAKY